MPSLRELIQNAGQQISGNAKGTASDVTGGVRSAVSSAEHQVTNSSANAVNAAVNTGVSGLLGAAASAFTGDFSGAAQQLQSLTGQSINAAFNAFSLGGAGGVIPGDALTGAEARLDPLMAYCWYADMPTLPAIMPSTKSVSMLSDASQLLEDATTQTVITKGNRPKNVTNLPWYYVEGATPSFRHFAPKTVFRNGKNIHFPGSYSVSDLSIDMYVDNSNAAIGYLQTWNNRIMSNQTVEDSLTSGGSFGIPSQYKKPITFYLLSVSKQAVMVLHYEGCWPINVQQFTLSSGDNHRIIANVTFSVDDVFTEILPVTQFGVANVLGGNLSIKGLAASIVQSGISDGVSLIQKGASLLGLGSKSAPSDDPSN